MPRPLPSPGPHPVPPAPEPLHNCTIGAAVRDASLRAAVHVSDGDEERAHGVLRDHVPNAPHGDRLRHALQVKANQGLLPPVRSSPGLTRLYIKLSSSACYSNHSCGPVRTCQPCIRLQLSPQSSSAHGMMIMRCCGALEGVLFAGLRRANGL